MYWAWGLDGIHAIPGAPTDPNMQQATVNLLADMGTQPATLASGLLPAGGRAVSWDGRNQAGERLAAGNYFVRLTRGGATLTRKLLYLR